MATWIAVIAFVIGFVAFAYAWKLQQELAVATRRLDRYNKSLFEANDELRRLREEVTETTAQLRVEIRRQGGQNGFEPEMTVREAQLLHPQAQQILAGFHLGGCSSCAVEPDATLAAVCADHGVDVQQLVQTLNRLVIPANGQRGQALQPVKVPNVELNF
ncbi:MAG: hypothetical protein DCC55_22560 [Chloroflexi bacterium]|nr:MAG: hypothetical protein DCC55_22560 [Chloroflexota bacterium]